MYLRRLRLPRVDRNGPILHCTERIRNPNQDHHDYSPFNGGLLGFHIVCVKIYTLNHMHTHLSVYTSPYIPTYHSLFLYTYVFLNPKPLTLNPKPLNPKPFLYIPVYLYMRPTEPTLVARPLSRQMLVEELNKAGFLGDVDYLCLQGFKP